MSARADIAFEAERIALSRQVLDAVGARNQRPVRQKTERHYRDFHRTILHQVETSGESLATALAASGRLSHYRVLVSSIRRIEAAAARSLLVALDALGHERATNALRQDLLERLEISTSRLRQTLAQPTLMDTPVRARARSLALLAPDWLLQLERHASPRVLLAIRIMSLTGCRPVEIARGVQFQIGNSKGVPRLTLSFINAKRRDGARPQRRTLNYLPAPAGGADRLVDDLVAMLQRHVDIGAMDLFDIRSGSVRIAHLSEHISALARRLWPLAATRPSTYHLRYAFRAELKHDAQRVTGIAQAMGHTTTGAQLAYGRGCHVARPQSRALVLCASAQVRRIEAPTRARQRGEVVSVAALLSRRRDFEHDTERTRESGHDLLLELER